jgi:hypothetical protein
VLTLNGLQGSQNRLPNVQLFVGRLKIQELYLIGQQSVLPAIAQHFVSSDGLM